MGDARHRFAPIGIGALAVALLVLFVAGCGSSESGPSSGEPPQGRQAPAGAGATARSCTASMRGVGSLRATGVACSAATVVADAWVAKRECAMPAGASRASCTVGGYRCLAATSERGLAVSCARPGRSISLVARRR